MSVYVVAAIIAIMNVVVCFEKRLNKKSRYILICLYLLSYALLFAARDFSFPDTEAYYQAFANLNPSNIYFEKFNVYLMQIIKIIFGNSFRIYLLICVVLNETLILYSMHRICKLLAKEQDMIWNIAVSALAMYFSYFGFIYNGAIIRQGIAMSFVVLAITFILEKRYIPMMISLFVAYQFHTVALVGIVIIGILFFSNFTKKIYYAWWGGIFLCWLLNGSYHFWLIFKNIIVWLNGVLPNLKRVTYYVLDGTTIRMNGRVSYKDILFMLLALYVIIYMEENKVYKRLLTIYLVGVTLMVALNSLVISYRLYDVFLIFGIPLILKDIEKIPFKTDLQRKVCLFCLCTVMVIIGARFLNQFN